MKTAEKAKEDLLSVLPFIRYAIEQASQEGIAKLGIMCDQENGGKIMCRFGCGFVEDLALVLGAPAMSDEDRKKAAAMTILAEMQKPSC